MSRTVDVVISGDDDAVLRAAVSALHHGHRVLVVLKPNAVWTGRRLRRHACRVADVWSGQLTVMTHAIIVCVDGIAGVEAVVIRNLRTGRLCAVNASVVHVV